MFNLCVGYSEGGKAEHKAYAYLSQELRALGQLTLVPSVFGPTAVIAVFDTGRAGSVIALRAEMDAPPLESGLKEPESHDPRSEIDGVMHNCGHDLHAGILLATAKYVVSNPGRFAGKIVFLFQPAEETAGGADDILPEGVLDRLGVTKISRCMPPPGCRSERSRSARVRRSPAAITSH
jgi:amidohydrolase